MIFSLSLNFTSFCFYVENQLRNALFFTFCCLFFHILILALCKRAEKRELKESQKISLNPALVSSLDGVLIDVYGNLRPRPVDYERRRTLVRVFNTMATEIFGN